MIIVKKINQQQIMVHSDLIETIEFSPHAPPDTDEALLNLTCSVPRHFACTRCLGPF